MERGKGKCRGREGKKRGERETNPIPLSKVKLMYFITVNKYPVSLKMFRVDALVHSPSLSPFPSHPTLTIFIIGSFELGPKREPHIAFG